MAIIVKKAAKGDAPATGMPKTPAPTRQAPPDAVMEIRNPTAQSYGENGPKNNQSRTNPGQIVESDLARNLRESTDDGESVLDQIIKGGAHSVDMGPHPDVNWQTRTLPPDNVPVHSAMRPANTGGAPAGQVPSKLGESVFNPNSIRKPGQ
jgi:hypothetical protein